MDRCWNLFTVERRRRAPRIAIVSKLLKDRNAPDRGRNNQDKEPDLKMVKTISTSRHVAGCHTARAALAVVYPIGRSTVVRRRSVEHRRSSARVVFVTVMCRTFTLEIN